MAAFRNPSSLLFLLVLALSPLLFPAVAEEAAGGDPCASSTFHLSEVAGAAATNQQTGLCPVNCFRPDPVCGVNGVTYWCGCSEAACAGVSVAKKGYCQVGGSVSGQALLLVHMVWLIVLGFAVLFGFL